MVTCGPITGSNCVYAAHQALYTARATATGGRAGHAVSVNADVTIGIIEGGGYGLAVALRVCIPGVDPETVRSLTEAAHQVCPYSNAMRGRGSCQGSTSYPRPGPDAKVIVYDGY